MYVLSDVLVVAQEVHYDHEVYHMHVCMSPFEDILEFLEKCSELMLYYKRELVVT